MSLKLGIIRILGLFYYSLQKYQEISTISYKIFETNSSFHVKWRSKGKGYSPFSGTFLLVLTKFLF